ncbi:MAG TPA: class I SAM-dependent rRNA methyltransferase [Chthoniobacteraceae bacterium]|jgi:23S rRNA (cytosine1962-C5)-methyltransferase|nr:class I SAM-dependent rRNA methyltransferase [Chthoniobacteraceae bacterium]
MAGIIVKPRARILHGHEWIYGSDILKTFGDPENGGIVSIRDGRDRLLGTGIYNAHSQIVVRRFSRQRQDLDLDFFQRRIAQAIEYRRRRGVNPQACRLVWSESDGLPGLIIDRYGAAFVVQTLTLAMDQRLAVITEALKKECGVEAPVIVERNDAPIRRAEGLELRTGLLEGSGTTQRVEILGLTFEIDVLHGQKTGFYLDQVENYRAVAQWAQGRRVLDCFTNQGAFALACAKGGAKAVTAVEISAEAVAQVKSNAKRNEVNLEAMEANVFDYLKQKETEGAQYDLIILDPPSFTKSKEKLHDALRGYKEIHLRAFKLLSPAGLLATFSCSHHVSGELFRNVIGDALVDAKRSARMIGSYHQNADHPIMATIPETEYLKGFLLEMAPGR